MQVSWGGIARQQWDQLHAARGGSLQQSWAYGEGLSRMGVTVHRAAVHDAQGRLICLTQIVVRRVLGYLAVGLCSRGPLWVVDAPPVRDALKAIRAEFRPWGLGVLLWTPDFDAPSFEGVGRPRVMTGMSTAMVDLTLTEEALRRQLERNWRNRLVKAEKSTGLQVFLNAARGPCTEILKRETLQRRDRRFTGLPVAFVEQYIDSFKDADRGFLLARAERRGELLAGMIFLIHGSRATYHIGWLDHGKEGLYGLHNLLLWRSMLELKRRQIRLLDLGGVNTVELQGISRFKFGTGGRLTQLAGTYL